MRRLLFLNTKLAEKLKIKAKTIKDLLSLEIVILKQGRVRVAFLSRKIINPAHVFRLCANLR